METENKKILLSGGGHKMAAGLKINYNLLDDFLSFLNDNLNHFSNDLFEKNENFDSILSVNEINNELLEIIENLEPFGAGNPEPKFIINDMVISSTKILKEKHLLVFFQNDFSDNLKAICFNCVNTNLGDYLVNFKRYKFSVGCTIKKNSFKDIVEPQIIIKDIMLIN